MDRAWWQAAILTVACAVLFLALGTLIVHRVITDDGSGIVCADDVDELGSIPVDCPVDP